LHTAIELASAAKAPLAEAEALHELALVHLGSGRNSAALRALTAAYRLFHGMGARTEQLYVGSKVAALKGADVNVVREWVRCMERNDSALAAHSERVARYAVAVARALRLDDEQETAILLGGYLHDVGRLRTGKDPDAAREHPLWGLALLE